MEAEIPLSSLFHRALTTASKASSLPTIEDDTQELVQFALADLRKCVSRVSQLRLFSANEQLADIPTRDLVYIVLPYVLSEVLSRVRSTDPAERFDLVNDVKGYLYAFIRSLVMYEIVTEDDKALYGPSASSVIDPTKRRELKIKQYKREKEIKARIEALRRNPTQNVIEPSSNVGMILSLLPDPSRKPGNRKADESDADTDDDDDDALREAVVLLLRYIYAEAQSQLDSSTQELQLLKSTPPPHRQAPSDDPRMARRRPDDDMWRIDAPINQGGPDGRGPLLDSQSKPLRPFTILPSNAAERARLQAQVFQPDHRLPTMTIDEYLDIERQRGNIITGGGPQSELEPTSKEQLAIDAEQDGTAFGEVKTEEKRQKDESWAQYTDTHAKGSGNTMNRG